MKKQYVIFCLLAALLPLAASAQGGVSLPYTMDFSGLSTGGNSFVPGWTRVDSCRSGNAVYPNIYDLGASSYASEDMIAHGNVMTFNGNSATSSGTMRAATPLLAAPLNQLEIHFWAQKNTLRLYAATDLTDQSTYHLIGTYSPGYAGGTYEVRTNNIAGLPSTPGYLVFTANFGTSSFGNDNPYLDDLTVESLNTCERPTQITVEQVTPTGASLTWPAVDNVTRYLVTYDTVNNFAAAAHSEEVTATNITLDYLESNTQYYVWVQSYCGTNLSNPREATFTTERNCYSVTRVHQVGVGPDAASFQWTLDSRGNDAEVVYSVLHDLSDPMVADIAATCMGSTWHIFTDLDPTHRYVADFYTLCYGDTSEVVSVPLTVRNCGETDLAGRTDTNDHDMYYPFSVNYKYSYSQTVYPAKVCYDMDTIRGMALRRTLHGGTLNRTLSIWMADTAVVSLPSAVSTNGMTCVANNVSFQLKGQEWDTLMFTTPFVHDGSSNIVVTIVDATGTNQYGSSCPRWFWHEDDGSVRYSYSDNSAYNAAAPGSISHNTNKLPDTRFVAECSDNYGCVAPVAAMGEMESSSATVAWAGGFGSSWSIEYRLSGTTEWTVADTVTQSPYTFTGLTPSMVYEARVGVICENETRYSDKLTFTTECDIMHIPFHFTQNDMCAAADNGFTSCWNFSQHFYRTRLTDSHRGTVYNAGNGEWFMLPPIAEPLSGARLRSWIASSDQGKVKVGVASLANCSDVVWVDTIDIPAGFPNTSHDEYIVYLDRYTGEGNRVVVSPIVNNNYHYIYFFDFHVEPIEACRPVENLVLDSASATTLSVSWTPMSAATQWAVYVNGAQRAVASGQPHYTITGLSPYTMYEVSVRSLCGDDSSALASENFRTACTGEQCTFTLDAHSSIGEGWYGAKLHIYAGGELIENFTMRQGSNLSGTYSVCANMPILFKWLSGNADSICSFELRNAAGDTIYSIAAGPGYTDTLYMSNDICSAVPGPACTNRYASTTQTACDSYQWRGRSLTASGTYRDTVAGAVAGGCDSIYTLILTIKQSVRVTLDTTVSEGFSWNGNTYTVSGTYSWTGTAANGCDSVVVINLVVTGSQGIDTPESLSLELYPNPTTGKVMLVADEIEKVEVFDAAGRSLLVVRDSDVVDLSHLVSGLYTLRITMAEGTAVRRVLKY